MKSKFDQLANRLLNEAAQYTSKSPKTHEWREEYKGHKIYVIDEPYDEDSKWVQYEVTLPDGTVKDPPIGSTYMMDRNVGPEDDEYSDVTGIAKMWIDAGYPTKRPNGQRGRLSYGELKEILAGQKSK